MNDARLAELREQYKNRNLLEELGWGTYANHSGYTSKQNGEFLNWLCNAAYRALKENKPNGEWIKVIDVQTERITEWHYECSLCGCKRSGVCEDLNNYCPNCGAKMEK